MENYLIMNSCSDELEEIVKTAISVKDLRRASAATPSMTPHGVAGDIAGAITKKLPFLNAEKLEGFRGGVQQALEAGGPQTLGNKRFMPKKYRGAVIMGPNGGRGISDANPRYHGTQAAHDVYARNVDDVVKLHEGFERKSILGTGKGTGGIPHKSQSKATLTHNSPTVLMDERNLVNKLHGSGAKHTSETMNKLRVAETPVLDAQLRKVYGERAMATHAKTQGRYSKAMRKDLARRKLSPLSKSKKMGMSRAQGHMLMSFDTPTLQSGTLRAPMSQAKLRASDAAHKAARNVSTRAAGIKATPSASSLKRTLFELKKSRAAGSGLARNLPSAGASAGTARTLSKFRRPASAVFKRLRGLSKLL